METGKIKSLAADGELVLFARPGCVHCEQLQFALELLKNRPDGLPKGGYRYVNIDDEPTARALYDELVPVLCLGERVICAGVFNIENLETDLRDL